MAKTTTTNETLEGLTKAAIHRIAQKAGATYVSSEIYDKVRKVVMDFLLKVIRRAALYVQQARKVTVSQDDILMSLETEYKKVYTSGHDNEVVKCKASAPRKSSNACLHFSIAGFERVVRGIAKDITRYDHALHFAADAIPTLQQVTEVYLYELFEAVCLLASHARRQTITVEDVQLVFKMPRVVK